nr:ABC transporter ATP-binding protein [uncultured Desulfobulbus sp.]
MTRVEQKAPLLQIASLSHCYGSEGDRLPVFSNLTGAVRQGELICLIGRSGCGKSTLLKIIAGFLRPTSGTCLLAEQAIQGPGPDRGVVFQEDALFPWLSVKENITFGLKAGASERAAVEDLLKQVGLAGCGHQLPRTLSGGMKQRVALARVLIRSPRILLMDEPFGALDAQTREEMQSLLLQLIQERQQTVIFVTHDVQEALLLADRIWLMGQGKAGFSRELEVGLERPRDPSIPQFQEQARQLHRWLRQ